MYSLPDSFSHCCPAYHSSLYWFFVCLHVTECQPHFNQTLLLLYFSRLSRYNEFCLENVAWRIFNTTFQYHKTCNNPPPPSKLQKLRRSFVLFFCSVIKLVLLILYVTWYTFPTIISQNDDVFFFFSFASLLVVVRWSDQIYSPTFLTLSAHWSVFNYRTSSYDREKHAVPAASCKTVKHYYECVRKGAVCGRTPSTAADILLKVRGCGAMMGCPLQLGLKRAGFVPLAAL